MKFTIAKSFILLILLSCSSNETAITPEPPVGPDGLIWSDEFDETGSPSSDKWTYDIGNGNMVGEIMRFNFIRDQMQLLKTVF